MFLNRQRVLTVLFSILLFLPSILKGNHVLYAKNPVLNKLYAFSAGADVRFSYRGYLGQLTEYRGKIAGINDSAVLLVKGLQKKDSLYLLVNDIQGFRPYSTGRILAKSATELVLFSGSLLLYTAVLSPSPLSAIARAGISLAAAGLSYQVVRWSFSDKVVNTKEKGWSFFIKKEPLFAE